MLNAVSRIHKKDTVKDMQGYIDIHSHILPGVDDGAENLEMSLKMLQIAQTEGIRRIILTPHNKPMRHNVGPESMGRRMEELQEALDQSGMEIRLYAGSEIYYRSDIVELLDNGKVCSMAGSDYVLIEFNPMDDYDYIRGGIYQLMAGGYKPILAHAERYKCVSASVQKAEELVSMGCYIQLNAGSVMGNFGYVTRHFCKQVLKKQLVHFVATDAHRADGKRAPYIEECARYIKKHFGEEYMRLLLQVHPAKVIADECI